MKTGVYYLGLHIFGVHPNYPLRKVAVIFNTIIILSFCFLTSLNSYLKGVLDPLESLTCFLLILIKYMVLIIKKDEMINILKMTYHFWKVEVKDDKITYFLKYLTKGQMYYTVLIVMGVLTYTIKPLVLKNTSMFNPYFPPEVPYPLLYVVEFYTLMLLSAVFTGFNMLICNIIILGAVQFRLLNLKIEALDFSDAAENYGGSMGTCINQIKDIIKHHQFLIRYVKGLNNILSVPMALLMIISVSILCLNMYILSLKTASQVEKSLAAITNMVVLLEFFFIYGFPAQLLMDEAEDTSRVVYYEINWYMRNIIPLRKYLLMIMMRSQKGVFIRAAKYHVINNQTVVLMIKTAYSFFTFLQTMA